MILPVGISGTESHCRSGAIRARLEILVLFQVTPKLPKKPHEIWSISEYKSLGLGFTEFCKLTPGEPEILGQPQLRFGLPGPPYILGDLWTVHIHSLIQELLAFQREPCSFVKFSFLSVRNSLFGQSKITSYEDLFVPVADSCWCMANQYSIVK